MDSRQRKLAEKLKLFVDDDPKVSENPVTIGINNFEAYLALKALEAQEKYENPMLIVPKDIDGR